MAVHCLVQLGLFHLSQRIVLIGQVYLDRAAVPPGRQDIPTQSRGQADRRLLQESLDEPQLSQKHVVPQLLGPLTL